MQLLIQRIIHYIQLKLKMSRKSIEEMIKRFTPEEWNQIIKTEMKELGLYFTGKKLDEPMNLFEELLKDKEIDEVE